MSETENCAANHGYSAKQEPPKWSDPITWFTGGLLIVAIVQWLVTRHQLKAMQETLAANRMGAEAGRDTVNTMKDTAEKQLRAYVVLVVGKDFIPGANPNDIRICIRNCGQTPAYRVRSVINCYGMPGGNAYWKTDAPLDIKWESGGSVFTLGSGDIHPHDTPVGNLFPGGNFPQILAAENAGNATLYFYGVVEYLDVFNKDRSTRFCLKHVPGRSLSDYSVHTENNECT